MATEHRGGSGNFAEDRQRASEAGHKGGQTSGGQASHEREQRPGEPGQKSAQGGNFASDRERASEAGRKGGQASHGTGHGEKH